MPEEGDREKPLLEENEGEAVGESTRLLTSASEKDSGVEGEDEAAAELMSQTGEAQRLVVVGAQVSAEDPDAWWNQCWWKVLHAGFFLTGGILFVWGTSLYLLPKDFPTGASAGWIYVIGSCGFGVDLLETITFTEESTELRFNIACSAFGSALYVLGSYGYVPGQPLMMGMQGFIWGSFVIGCSQFWKAHRLGSNGPEGKAFSIANLRANNDVTTAVLVELPPGLGAWCFFVGTLMYWHAHVPGSVWYTVVLVIWEIGSLFFFAGGAMLTYRHTVMGL